MEKGDGLCSSMWVAWVLPPVGRPDPRPRALIYMVGRGPREDKTLRGRNVTPHKFLSSCVHSSSAEISGVDNVRGAILAAAEVWRV